MIKIGRSTLKMALMSFQIHHVELSKLFHMNLTKAVIEVFTLSSLLITYEALRKFTLPSIRWADILTFQVM